MKFCIMIGGISVEICHRYDTVRCLCGDYLTEEMPAFSVSVSNEEIEAERTINDGLFGNEICEATCLHRKLVQGLVPYGLMLIHCAAIAVDGKAYLFLAKSGVGKSTHIKLWLQAFGERAVVVNGDKPMLSFVGDILTVHGSPWRGKEGWGANISRPVAGICLLERGEQNRIYPATNAETVSRIFHQMLLPKDPANLTRVMQFVDRMIYTVPQYRLECNRDIEAAFVSFEGMRKDEI